MREIVVFVQPFLNGGTEAPFVLFEFLNAAQPQTYIYIYYILTSNAPYHYKLGAISVIYVFVQLTMQLLRVLGDSCESIGSSCIILPIKIFQSPT